MGDADPPFPRGDATGTNQLGPGAPTLLINNILPWTLHESDSEVQIQRRNVTVWYEGKAMEARRGPKWKRNEKRKEKKEKKKRKREKKGGRRSRTIIYCIGLGIAGFEFKCYTIWMINNLYQGQTQVLWPAWSYLTTNTQFHCINPPPPRRARGGGPDKRGPFSSLKNLQYLAYSIVIIINSFSGDKLLFSIRHV